MVKLAQPVDPLVELRLVELRGSVDDQSSRPEVHVVEVGRVDTVSTRDISPAVLTGSSSDNNSSDDLIVVGTTKQVPSGDV